MAGLPDAFLLPQTKMTRREHIHPIFNEIVVVLVAPGQGWTESLVEAIQMLMHAGQLWEYKAHHKNSS